MAPFKDGLETRKADPYTAPLACCVILCKVQNASVSQLGNKNRVSYSSSYSGENVWE
jgi:hypothetical protein